MRKLATIRTIDRIMPHPRADLIELAFIGGWQVIVKKGELEEGDLCVYFEIDSVLPIREEFEFLRKSCYVKKDWLASENNPTGEGFRLKTIRLRGELSQGLIIPVSGEALDLIAAYEFYDRPRDNVNFVDVTDLYGVVKWDPPMPASLGGKARGYFPSFIPKTDQERVQNLADKVFTPMWQEDTWEVTTKMDGSSCTIYRKDGKVGICSRNLELDIDSPENVDNTFVRTVIDSGLYDIMKNFDDMEGIAFQAELMGPGIQGNQEGLQESALFIFDVYDIKFGNYMNGYIRSSFYNVLVDRGVNQYRVMQAPLQGYFKLEDIGKTMEELLAFAEGPSYNSAVREGVVLKSLTNPSRSFKIISNTWLEGGGE